jgi:DNA-binding IclR family transcriptional regulator
VKNDQTAYRNQAALRVLSVLDAFSGRIDPVSAGELGALLGMSKNMIHRALTLLEEEGLIVRAAAGNAYQLGPRVLGFSTFDDEQEDDVNAICRPYMESLAELTHESVFLGIIVGHNRVVIDKIEGVGRRVAHNQRGLAVPLHVSKASRVLLAYLTDREITAYLDAARPLADYADLFAASANETFDDVWKDVRDIRAQGFISWVSIQQYGGTYIAFPVLDAENRPHAVISVGGPSERFTIDVIAQYLSRMRDLMDQLRARSRLLPAAPPMLPMKQAA